MHLLAHVGAAAAAGLRPYGRTVREVVQLVEDIPFVACRVRHPHLVTDAERHLVAVAVDVCQRACFRGRWQCRYLGLVGDVAAACLVRLQPVRADVGHDALRRLGRVDGTLLRCQRPCGGVIGIAFRLPRLRGGRTCPGCLLTGGFGCGVGSGLGGNGILRSCPCIFRRGFGFVACLLCPLCGRRNVLCRLACILSRLARIVGGFDRRGGQQVNRRFDHRLRAAGPAQGRQRNDVVKRIGHLELADTLRTGQEGFADLLYQLVELSVVKCRHHSAFIRMDLISAKYCAAMAAWLSADTSAWRSKAR